jgi:hypothetical protein
MRAFALLALAGAALLAAAGMASGQLADVPSIISPRTFDDMLSNRSQRGCEGGAFYTYDAFLEAANASKFRGFGIIGDLDTRKRELAAFFAQTSHQTNGTVQDGATVLLKSYTRVVLGFCLDLADE